MPNTVGDRILYAIRSSGKTQSDVARILGLSRSTVNTWIRRKRPPREWELIARRIAQATRPELYGYLLTGSRNAPASEEILQAVIMAVETSGVTIEAPHRARLISVIYDDAISRDARPADVPGIAARYLSILSVIN